MPLAAGGASEVRCAPIGAPQCVCMGAGAEHRAEGKLYTSVWCRSRSRHPFSSRGRAALRLETREDERSLSLARALRKGECEEGGRG